MTSSYPTRRSVRLQHHDYAQAGAYFVTLCTEERRCLFGAIQGDAMHLSGVGHLIADTWAGLADRFPVGASGTPGPDRAPGDRPATQGIHREPGRTTGHASSRGTVAAELL